MAEYIEREAALKFQYWEGCGTICYGVVAVSDIENIPAADVVPVVRCKDCEHWGGVIFGNVCRRWSSPLAGMKNCTKPDDFCSYGELRTEGR